jgi:hypothetical protein
MVDFLPLVVPQIGVAYIHPFNEHWAKAAMDLNSVKAEFVDGARYFENAIRSGRAVPRGWDMGAKDEYYATVNSINEAWDHMHKFFYLLTA